MDTALSRQAIPADLRAHSSCVGTGERGGGVALPLLEHPPNIPPAAACAARTLSKPCRVPGSVFGDEGLGNPPEQTPGAALATAVGGDHPCPARNLPLP